MYSERRQIENLKDLNDKFFKRKLCNDEFYSQLRGNNIDVDGSVMIEIVPDDVNTFFGALIKQDGSLVKFIVDCDDPKFSEWTVVNEYFGSKEFIRLCREKPLSNYVLAHKFYSNLTKQGIQLRDE